MRHVDGVERQEPPLRLGVLGCADIARRRTVPALLAADGVDVTAVASRDPGRAESFAAEVGCAAVGGYGALLASDDIDAVYIPLPSALHAEWTEKALDAGKHVLAEKPLTTDYETTARLLRLARTRGLVLLENVTFLHHSQHTAVQKMLADGAIGELRDFSSAFTIPPLPAGNTQFLPGLGGGALLEQGVYPIRAALRFLGNDLDVTAAVLHVDGGTGMVVGGRALACTPGGVTADLAFGVRHSYRTGCEFAGSAGRLLTDRAFTPPAAYQPVVRIERQDHREEITLPPDHQWANLGRFFARAVGAARVAGAAGAARTAPGPGAGAEAGTGGEPEAFGAGSLHQARLVSEIEERARRITV
nr:oxidoreductase [Actinomadura sp.]